MNRDDLPKAKQAVEENKLNWRSFQGSRSESKISTDWLIDGWPTGVVFDAERRIRYRGHNGHNGHEATTIAYALVAAMKSSPGAKPGPPPPGPSSNRHLRGARVVWLHRRPARVMDLSWAWPLLRNGMARGTALT